MGVNGDYAEGGLDVSLGHKSTLPEGEEEMDGIAPNVWLHSSVGRASHRYHRGHRLESR